MARQLGELVLAAACLLSIQTSFGQNSSPAQPPPTGVSTQAAVPGDAAGVQAWRDYLEQLPPDQKEKLAQNLKKWEALSPEEREALRSRAAARLARLQQAAGAAIAQSVLTLTPEQRQTYFKSYLEGRNEIERPLRLEMQRERKPLVEDMLKKLDAEFAALPPLSDGTNQEAAEVVASPPPGAPEVKGPFQRMEIDRAIKQSGLTLDGERRDSYVGRYIQMRKKIEQQLHQEMETKRKPQVDALVERLKAEFSSPPPQ
jgi:hypothetical protein